MTTPEIELAWAAGFFEGEGWIYVPPAEQSRRGLQVFVAQSSADENVPPMLLRFQKAVGGRGVIAPQKANDLSRKQRWKWMLTRRWEALDVVKMLTPYMTGDPFLTKVGPVSATRLPRVM